MQFGCVSNSICDAPVVIWIPFTYQISQYWSDYLSPQVTCFFVVIGGNCIIDLEIHSCHQLLLVALWSSVPLSGHCGTSFALFYQNRAIYPISCPDLSCLLWWLLIFMRDGCLSVIITVHMIHLLLSRCSLSYFDLVINL